MENTGPENSKADKKQSMVVEFRVVNISKVAVVSGKELKVELWGR